jgi:hypothetical protein
MIRKLVFVSSLRNRLNINRNRAVEWALAVLILLSIQPWFVWGFTEWNVRIISILTILLSLTLIKYSSIRQNYFIALFYFLSVMILSFGGMSGYKLPTHVELAMFIFILSFSKHLLTRVLSKFETLLSYLFLGGIFLYIILLFADLPYFYLQPLNHSKLGVYRGYLFLLKNQDNYTYSAFRFMSVFDEPGVIGSLLALLISYKDFKFDNFRDNVFIIAGLLSFSLVFYIVLIINVFYSKYIKWRTILLLSLFFLSLYNFVPGFMKNVLLDRVYSDGGMSIQDNRSTSSFLYKYDQFKSEGEKTVIFGMGPNSIQELSQVIELNVSSYKTIVYQYGYFGLCFFMLFFLISTWKLAPTRRGIYFYLIFLLVGWQRPGVYSYFNILIFFGGLSYISQEYSRKKIIYFR